MAETDRTEHNQRIGSYDVTQVNQTTIQQRLQTAEQALAELKLEARALLTQPVPELPVAQFEAVEFGVRAVAESIGAAERILGDRLDRIDELRRELAARDQVLAQAGSLGLVVMRQRTEAARRTLREQQGDEEQLKLLNELQALGQQAAEWAAKNKRLTESLDQSIQSQRALAQEQLELETEIRQFQAELNSLPQVEKIEKDREECVRFAAEVQRLHTEIRAHLGTEGASR